MHNEHKVDGKPIPVTVAGQGLFARLRQPGERGVKLVILPSIGDAPEKRKTQSGQPQFFVLGDTRANGRHG